MKRILCILFALASLAGRAQEVVSLPDVSALMATDPRLVGKRDGNGTLQALVEVNGRVSAGDGGKARWRWADGATDPTNAVRIAKSGGQWQLVPDNDTISSRQWGLADGTDDLVAMQAFVDYTAENNLTAYLDDGSYVLTNSLVLPSNLNLVGTYNSVFERAAVSSQTNLHVWSALKTDYTFNPYITNGGFTGSTVPGLVTNVTLKGFRLKTADNYHSSFGIAAFCAQGWLLEDLTIDRMTNHWAVTYFGNDIRTHNCVINNGGSVFQDGLHVIGGDKLVFTGNIVNSGDDAYALTTGYLQQQDISNVTISGNIANSTHGHAVRLAIENFSGTNRIYNVVVDGLTGYAGRERNALVRSESNSTNVLYGITNVSLAHIRLKGGDLADHGGVIAGAAYGYHIHNADNVVITDCHVGPTVLWNYYLKNVGRITLTDCTGDGAQWTNLNSTIYAEDVEALALNGGRYQNASLVDADTVWLRGVGRASIIGTHIENAYTNRAALTLASVASDHVTMIGSTLTNSLGYALTSYVNPAELVMVGNTLGSAQGVVWQGSSPPTQSVIANNLGLSGGGPQSATEFVVTSSTGAYLGGVGSRLTRMRFSSTNGAFVFAQDDGTGATKTVRVSGQPYNSANNPISAFVTQDTGATPTLYIGGGSSLVSSPSVINFDTPASGYGTGVDRMRLTTTGFVVEPGGVSSNPTSSEALAVRSTSRGVMLSKMTAAQFAAIGSKAAGLQGYNSTDNRPIWYNGSADRNAAAIEEVQPATETLTASGGTLTITAGKGPNQSSRWVADGNVTLAFASLADNNGGRLRVWPATTNVTITLPNYASGPSGSTLTVNGGTGSTNYTEIVWVNGVESSTNRVSINALNYYR